MKKAVLLSLAAFVCTTEMNAQVTVKKDVMQYYTALPAMPASLQEAYQKSTCKSGSCNSDSVVAPIQRNLNADTKSMGALTATQQQQMQQGQALGKQVQAAGVDKMNDDQKLQYAQGNSQMNGGNPQAIAWAQKMKDDPAEKAKFQAMTPDQKMAYMQQNGLMNGYSGAMPAATPAKDSSKATDALNKQKQMQATESSADKIKLVLALNDQTDMSKLNAAHAQIDAKEQTELNAAGNNAAARTAIENKYMQQHLALALTQVQSMAKAYQDLYSFYMKAETDFGTALVAANYGYTGDASQDQNVNTLAMGQNIVLTNINSLAGYVKTIYQFAADWQAKSLQK